MFVSQPLHGLFFFFNLSASSNDNIVLSIHVQRGRCLNQNARQRDERQRTGEGERGLFEDVSE